MSMEFKEELELLLNNFIIAKEKNPDDYYKVKAKIKKIREFTTTKLGCDIIINSNLIKLEKIPSIIDNTFQMEDFDSIKEYPLFVLVIMFLEDKAKDEQFILSNLTSFIVNNLATILEKRIQIDFKDFHSRKCLVDVLKYCIKLGMIKLIDGNDELFKESMENEALYQNTGISHYIIRQFKEDIFTYQEPKDFLNTTNMEDVLNKKRYYTYRSLLFYPFLRYSDFDSEVYNYFINYRNRILADLNGILDGELLIFNNIALLTTTEKNSRTTFPNSRKMIHDIVLLVNDYLVNEVDNLQIDRFTFERLLKKIHQENKQYFSKEFREMNLENFFIEVTRAMENFKLLEIKEDTILFSPLIYLISGNYPPQKEESKTFEQLNIETEDAYVSL